MAIAYDGSSRASGLALYVDGRRAPIEVVRDHLTKTITGGGNDQITIGQRFRDRGFKNGLVDEIKVFDRAITPLEAAQLFATGPLRRFQPTQPADGPSSVGTSWPTISRRSIREYTKQLAVLKDLRKQQSLLVDPVAEIMVMKELPAERPTYLLKRGSYECTGQPRRAGHAGELAAVFACSTAQPARAGAMADRSQPPADGTGGGQSMVAGAFWPRDRVDARGFRQPGPASLASGIARLAGADVDRQRLGCEADGAADRHVRDVPAKLRHPRPISWPGTRRTSCWPGDRGSGCRLRCCATMPFRPADCWSTRLAGRRSSRISPPGLWEEKSGLAYDRDRGRAATAAAFTLSGNGRRPPPAMLTFDATTREFCAVKRQTTATPLQALVLLNDPQYVEAARRWRSAPSGRGDEPRRPHHLRVPDADRPSTGSARACHARSSLS